MSDLRDCVLVVDDDAMIADFLGMVVQDMGVAVCGSAATGPAAIALADETRPKVVLMDVRLRGEMDGVDAAVAIRARVGSRIIFITGSREPATAVRTQADLPTTVLFKPVSDRQVQAAVREAMLA